MRWQRAARAVVAGIGVSTAVAVYVLTRERPAVSPPPSMPMADPRAAVQSGAGEEIRHDGSRLIGTLQYESLLQYEDGRIGYTKVRYAVENGAVISADVVERMGQSAADSGLGELALTGSVRVRTGDGTTLEGETATYDDATGLATVPGRVTFSRGRLEGGGTGGRWDRDSGVITLLEDAQVVIASAEGGGTPVEASSRTITMAGAGTMMLEGNSRIARDAETLTAHRATVYLSEDEQQFRAIELRGRARVSAAPGKTSDLPDMAAEDIDLAFYAESQALERASLRRGSTMVVPSERGRRVIEAPEISFSTSPDGRTLTRLDAGEGVVVRLPADAGTPARTITARTLTATGAAGSGLTAAVFEGGAKFIEEASGGPGRPDPQRTGTAQRLLLTTRGQLDAIETATFDRETTFTSGDVRGEADQGVYHATKGELELRPTPRAPRRLPHVTNGAVDVDAADLVSVDLNSNDLHAHGDVRTVTRGARPAPGSTPDVAIFSDRLPLYGSGSEFHYDATEGTARYLGAPAWLKQDESEVFGDEVLFFEEERNLTATGNVSSIFIMAAGPGPSSGDVSTRYRVTAHSLTYVEVTRAAAYEGTPGTSAVLTGVDGETSAAKLTLVLAGESRALEGMYAEGEVHSVLQGGREARGDSLIYEADGSRYTLKGRPLALWTREEDGTCSSQSGNFVRFAGNVGAPDFPASDNPGGAPLATGRPCPPSLSGAK